MVNIFYKDGTPVEDPNKPGRQLSYHIEPKALKFLSNKVIPMINKKDKDFVYNPISNTEPLKKEY